jgi:uncharacterized protein (TIGR02466 family)
MKSFFPLFSSVIYVSEIEEPTDLFEYIKNQEFYAQNSITKNKSSALQSSDLNLLDKFPHVKKKFLNEFYLFKNNVLHYKNTDFEITTSWSTKTTKGTHGSPHKHSNNFYSGVYYFGDCDDKTAPLEFTGLFHTPTDFCFEATEYNVYNSSEWSINPQKNMLVLFPAYLVHNIGMHLSDNPRYSLAFNVMPSKPYGTRDNMVR